MPTVDSTPATIDNPNDRARKRRLLQVSGDAAILLLLFSAMFSSWVLVVVAGALFVGLLIYAWFNLHQPERNAFVLRAVAAGVVAAGIAAVGAVLWR